MSRSRRLTLLLPLLCAAAAGCGSEGIQLAEDDRYYQAAQTFNESCGACHTFTPAGTEGSAFKVETRENKDGPNFNERQESVEDVLYAIQNGGFSSGPMPQNILTGEEAQAVAEFVAEYSGFAAERPPTPQESGQ